MPDARTADEQAWIDRDDALRSRAKEIAAAHGRDADDIYHALIQLQRSPSERLGRGLAHARLHPKFR